LRGPAAPLCALLQPSGSIGLLPGPGMWRWRRRHLLMHARRAGDGDCGSTLKRGGAAIAAALAENPADFDTAAGAAARLAAAVRSMGGTSGALYSLGLSAAAGARLLASAGRRAGCAVQ